MMSRRWIFLISLLLGLATAWEVWEQDVFWQIRAGDEILTGQGLQHQDHWSFTAAGKPWENIQWLATVCIRLAFYGGIPGLIVLRVALAAAFFLLFLLLFSDSNEKRENAWLAVAISVYVFCVVAFKMEVRSDTFVFLIFGSILLLWRTSGIPDTKRAWMTLGLTILAANLHAGTTPFVVMIGLANLALCHGVNLRKKFLMGILTANAILVTPYGIDIFHQILYVFFYSQNNFLDNYDHYGLTFNAFALSNFGVASWAWIPYAILGWIGTLQLLPRRPLLQKAIYVAPGVILTAYACSRMRVFPYHVLYFAPAVGHCLRSVAARWSKPMVTGTLASLAALCVGLHLHFFSLHYRWALSPAAFPLGSGKFLANNAFQDPMLHTYGFGGYFVWWLRDHLDFADTRETIFADLQRELLDASASPLKFRELVEKYHINTAILPIPAQQYVENMGFIDAFASVLPADDWAMVYFDDISAVFLRRTPENMPIIAKHAILILRPNVPAGAYPYPLPSNPEFDTRYAMEVARCVGDEPENLLCAMAAARLARKSADRVKMEEAYNALQKLAWKGADAPAYEIEIHALEKARQNFHE